MHVCVQYQGGMCTRAAYKLLSDDNYGLICGEEGRQYF